MYTLCIKLHRKSVKRHLSLPTERYWEHAQRALLAFDCCEPCIGFHSGSLGGAFITKEID